MSGGPNISNSEPADARADSPCPWHGDRPAGCPLHAPPSVAESLARAAREAARGTLDTGRYRCRYIDWGSGPPLLFVPGLADDAESFVLLMARLAEAFRCVAYDLPNGVTDGARLRRYTHADLVSDALALLDHLGVRQAYLFGSSFGSTIALEAMRRQPARFPRAILQGGFARRPLAPAEILLALLARHCPGPMHRLPGRLSFLRRVHGGPFHGRDPAAWELFVHRSNAAPMAAVAHRAMLLHRLDLRPTLAQLRQPVLLVCGEADPLVGRTCEDELLRGLPCAVRVELAGCGHNPLFSHPDVLADVVRRFLTPQDGPPGRKGHDPGT